MRISQCDNGYVLEIENKNLANLPVYSKEQLLTVMVERK